MLGDEQITFWASRYNCMNDPDDCLFGLNAMARNYPEELPIWYYPYVVSFSQDIDSFYMWQCYKADIVLVFNEILLSEIEGWDLITCTYEEDIEEALESEAVYWKQFEYNEIGKFLAKYKRKDFREEKEVRLVTVDQEVGKAFDSEVYDGEVPIDVKARINARGKLCLYKEVNVCSNALIEIIVRSKSDEEFLSVQNDLLLLLKSHQIFMQKEQIQRSKCSYVEF